MRTSNDRSVKTIKFLEQYAKLCTKYDRQLAIGAVPAGVDTTAQLVVDTIAVNAEALALIKSLPEA